MTTHTCRSILFVNCLRREWNSFLTTLVSLASPRELKVKLLQSLRPLNAARADVLGGWRWDLHDRRSPASAAVGKLESSLRKTFVRRNFSLEDANNSGGLEGEWVVFGCWEFSVSFCNFQMLL